MGGSGLVDAGRTARAYAVTESDGDVCLVLATAEVSSAGCAPLSSAASERPIILSGVDGGVPVTVGLLRDGTSRVDVARPGAGSTSQAVDGNVFAVRGRASSVSWVDRSGSRHAESLAVPAGASVSGCRANDPPWRRWRLRFGRATAEAGDALSRSVPRGA
jgi:hypothetical protein